MSTPPPRPLLVALALLAAAPLPACDRKRPPAHDAAQRELERRHPALMEEMDKIAAQSPAAAPSDSPMETPASPPADAPQPDPPSPR